MIRKAFAAFVAFMLGVTFAAVSASFHHRPEIQSVRIEVTAHNIHSMEVRNGSSFVICNAHSCEWDTKTRQPSPGSDTSDVPSWTSRMHDAYNNATLLYQNTTADFGDLFTYELELSFSDCSTSQGLSYPCDAPGSRVYSSYFGNPKVTLK